MLFLQNHQFSRRPLFWVENLERSQHFQEAIVEMNHKPRTPWPCRWEAAGRAWAISKVAGRKTSLESSKTSVKFGGQNATNPGILHGFLHQKVQKMRVSWRRCHVHMNYIITVILKPPTENLEIRKPGTTGTE